MEFYSRKSLASSGKSNSFTKQRKCSTFLWIFYAAFTPIDRRSTICEHLNLKFKLLLISTFISSCTENRNEEASMKYKANLDLLASAVLIVLLKILGASDRYYNQTFDIITRDIGDEHTPTDLNELSAIIFDFIINHPDV
jgi:hypothetical protein